MTQSRKRSYLNPSAVPGVEQGFLRIFVLFPDAIKISKYLKLGQL